MKIVLLSFRNENKWTPIVHPPLSRSAPLYTSINVCTCIFYMWRKGKGIDFSDDDDILLLNKHKTWTVILMAILAFVLFSFFRSIPFNCLSLLWSQWQQKTASTLNHIKKLNHNSIYRINNNRKFAKDICNWYAT